MLLVSAWLAVSAPTPLELVSRAEEEHGRGDTSASLVTLRAATHLAPTFGRAYFELGNLLAAAAAQSGVEGEPWAAQRRRELMRREAEKMYRTSIGAAGPPGVRAQLERGSIAVDSALAAVPTAMAINNLARLLSTRGRFDEAETLLRSALQTNHHDQNHHDQNINHRNDHQLAPSDHDGHLMDINHSGHLMDHQLAAYYNNLASVAFERAHTTGIAADGGCDTQDTGGGVNRGGVNAGGVYDGGVNRGGVYVGSVNRRGVLAEVERLLRLAIQRESASSRRLEKTAAKTAVKVESRCARGKQHVGKQHVGKERVGKEHVYRRNLFVLCDVPRHQAEAAAERAVADAIEMGGVSQLLSAEGRSLSAGGGSLPAGGASLSPGGASLSAEGGSLPARGGALSAGGGALSAGGGALSTGGGSALADKGAISAGGGSDLADNGAISAGAGSVLADNGAISAGEGAISAGEGAISAGEEAVPPAMRRALASLSRLPPTEVEEGGHLTGGLVEGYSALVLLLPPGRCEGGSTGCECAAAHGALQDAAAAAATIGDGWAVQVQWGGERRRGGCSQEEEGGAS